MKNDLISIIIPVYNAEKTLDRCIESALNQTYKNLQVILIDDGSSDNSWKICQEYKQHNSNITAISQTNLGAAMARNRGLDVAEGEFICFLDSDDEMDPAMVEKLYNACMQTGRKICGCSCRMHFKDHDKFSRYSKNPSGDYPTEFLLESTLKGTDFMYGALWDKMYHKSLIDLLYADNMPLEDIIIIANLYLHEEEIFILDEPLYNQYVVDGSLSRSAIINRSPSIVVTFKNLFSVLNNRQANSKIFNAANAFKINITFEAIRAVSLKDYKLVNYIFPTCKEIIKAYLSLDIKDKLNYKLFAKTIISAYKSYYLAKRKVS